MIMKVKKIKIENNDLHIIDNVLKEEVIEDFYGIIKGLPFTKNERDHEEDEYPIFSVDFHLDRIKEMDVGVKALELLEKFCTNNEYSLYRAYVNMSHFGDMEFPHRDCPIEEDHVTVLYYANTNWPHHWGGETLFYENHDTCYAVIPKPGRFAIFHGAIEHTGSVPTRACNFSRYSLALKFKTN